MGACHWPQCVVATGIRTRKQTQSNPKPLPSQTPEPYLVVDKPLGHTWWLIHCHFHCSIVIHLLILSSQHRFSHKLAYIVQVGSLQEKLNHPQYD